MQRIARIRGTEMSAGQTAVMHRAYGELRQDGLILYMDKYVDKRVRWLAKSCVILLTQGESDTV